MTGVSPSSRALVGMLLLAAAPVAVYALVPLPLDDHLALALVLCAVGMVIAKQYPARRAVVGILSLAVSLRYIAWRLDGTVVLSASMDGFASVSLLGAELFGLFLLVTGYFQATFARARPLGRLPPLEAQPTVDIMVPSYDEDVNILRRTLVGATAIDYARKRVYLLDEQRRPAVRDLCEELGVTWVTRPDNRGAKAGNLNHAMAQTDGELIAVFDADQVPVRSFLRTTVPAFVADPRLALVQTPHHFYNPDPFERNLHVEDEIPAEHLIFYQLIQVGNDFWNSAFFCGSCAVLRRTALAEVGGIATETVTEDAHTALKLHARGWRSAYLPIVQAAGLATERYAFHVTQRVRWARGMLQILRLDNPLAKPGLSVGQRVNYLAATAHFLFGLPRLAYLLAPPAFLVFGLHPVAASAVDIAAYALPHVFLSIVGSSMVSQSTRHSFWAEVYEVAIAPYIAIVTILTLVAPRHARFKVTTKGAQLDRARFDLRRAWPNLIAALLVMAAVIATPFRWQNAPDQRATIALASAWNLYNLMILAPALLVALDRPQRRENWRVRRAGRVWIEQGGHVWHGRLVDIGEDGLRAWGPPSQALDPAKGVRLTLRSARGVPLELEATVLDVRSSAEGADLRLRLHVETPAQRRALLEEIFSGASSWLPSPVPIDRPLRAAWLLVRTPWRALRSSWRERVGAGT